MHIKDMLSDAEKAGHPTFSFEFFPPKTAQGVQNLYDRMDRMHGLGPSFIDITWGAGGTLAELTLEMVSVAQSQYGLETCMHLTVRPPVFPKAAAMALEKWLRARYFKLQIASRIMERSSSYLWHESGKPIANASVLVHRHGTRQG